MKGEFKKGESVIHISLWNRAGHFVFERATVQACGAKRMILLSERTGSVMGRDFCPLVGFKSIHNDIEAWAAKDGRPFHHVCSNGTFKDMSDEEAVNFCLKLSAEWIAADLERLEACKASSTHIGYINAIQKEIDALKVAEPSASQR